MKLTASGGKTNKKTARSIGRSYQSLALMLGITLLMFGGIGSRLAYLQLIAGTHNRQQAEDNRIRLIPKQPERGSIFDRKGRILASSRLSHSVYVWPIAPKKPQWAVTRKRLAQILNMPEAEIQKRMDKAGYNSPTLIRIARDLNPAQITRLAESENQLADIEMFIEGMRTYPNGQLAAHILGYTGEMNDEQLANKRKEGYRLGDVIGQMGVEAAYEKELRGEWGGQQVEVDGAGRILRYLGDKKAKSGQDIHLTIDLELQKAAEKTLGDRQGAIVALDPRTGGVLAMVSRPTFDPNIFSKRFTPAVWRSLQKKDHPFVNRALRGFPPASTFKIITTTAGLESGKFTPKTVLPTYGCMNIGGTNFCDWNHAGFGPLGFVGGLTWSSDTFFYQIGRGVGGPTLIDWTRRYGFGRKTGIELAAEEAKGLVADEKWKQLNYKLPWSVGDTVNMAIGQGFLQVTPLQVAVMFSVPANGGYKVTPHLLKDDEDKKKLRESMHLKPTTVQTIREGLRGVVAGGTGKALNSPTIPPASGKSGTAETYKKKSHTWFGGFAPSNNPEIVVVAFAEHSGGGGGKLCAPMVLKVMEAYFHSPQKSGVKLSRKS